MNDINFFQLGSFDLNSIVFSKSVESDIYIPKFRYFISVHQHLTLAKLGRFTYMYWLGKEFLKV